MKIIKLCRHDEPLVHHTYCPHCHRWLSGTEIGCYFCCECGTPLEWNNKQRKVFDDDSKLFASQYYADRLAEINMEQFGKEDTFDSNS